MKLTEAAAAVAASCSELSFQLLSLLPPPLLALVASHLEVDSLLCLQRCSSSLHSLCAGESYCAVAWRHAMLRLNTHRRLHDWAVPYEACVFGRQYLIVASVWRDALPALNAVVAARERAYLQSMYWLRLRVARQQPVERVLVRRDADGTERVANKKRATHSCEVLSDVTWDDVKDATPEQRDVEVRCRLVLQACPHLRHLDLTLFRAAHVEPHNYDTFALLPRLRSLSLSQDDYEIELTGLTSFDKPPVDFALALDSLPCLASLRCAAIQMSVRSLLAIACHSTLEQLHIEAAGAHKLAETQWIGDELHFPGVDEQEDERRLRQEVRAVAVHGSVEEEKDSAQYVAPAAEVDSAEPAAYMHWQPSHVPWEASSAEKRDNLNRMRRALARTQPTRRSCETRLALANWLHRRLRRGGLPTDDSNFPAWLLRHYRALVALLRSTLQRQLSELAAASLLETVDEARVGVRRLESTA